MLRWIVSYLYFLLIFCIITPPHFSVFWLGYWDELSHQYGSWEWRNAWGQYWRFENTHRLIINWWFECWLFHLSWSRWLSGSLGGMPFREGSISLRYRLEIAIRFGWFLPCQHGQQWRNYRICFFRFWCLLNGYQSYFQVDHLPTFQEYYIRP